MRRRLWHAVGMAVAVMAVESARGQAGAGPPGPGEMKVGGDAQQAVRWVEQLGSGDFTEREAAEIKLQNLGWGALGAVEAGRNGRDPEVRARCAALLAKSEDLIPTWLPTRFRPALRTTKGGTTAPDSQILEYWANDEPTAYLLKIYAPLKNSELSIVERQRTSLRARELIVSGDWQAAATLLTGQFSDKHGGADLAALLALANGKKFDAGKMVELLQRQGAMGHPAEEFLYRAAGDWKMAETMGNAAARRAAAIEARDYEEVLRQMAEWVGPHRDLNDAVALHYLGREEEARAIEDEVVRAAFAAGGERGEAAPRPRAVQQLILCDRLEDAQRVLLATGDYAALARVMYRRLEVQQASIAQARASETVELAEDLARAGLEVASRRAIEAARKTLREAVAPDFNTDANAHLRLAILMERAGLADAPAERRAAFEPFIDRRFPFSPSTALLREMAPPGGAVLDTAAVGFWLNEMIDSKEAIDVRWARVERVAAGKLTQDDAKNLVEKALGNLASLRMSDDVRVIETVGAALHASGQDNAAVDLALRWSTRENDPSSLSVLGDIALDKGDAAAAVVWYQRAAMFRRTDAGLMYRTAAAMSRVPGMRAVAKELRAYVPLLVLGDRAMAQRVRGYMEKYEGAATADDWFDDFTRRFGPDDPAAMELRLEHARQRAQAAGDWDAALATVMQQRLVDSPMDPDAAVRAMHVMADYWRVRAMVALNKKNWTETEKALTRMMDYAAPDAGVLEQTIPAFFSADPAAARRVLAVARGRLQAVVVQYPEATRYVGELKRVAALGA